jgi:hypothetical protein
LGVRQSCGRRTHLHSPVPHTYTSARLPACLPALAPLSLTASNELQEPGVCACARRKGRRVTLACWCAATQQAPTYAHQVRKYEAEVAAVQEAKQREQALAEWAAEQEKDATLALLNPAEAQRQRDRCVSVRVSGVLCASVRVRAHYSIMVTQARSDSTHTHTQAHTHTHSTHAVDPSPQQGCHQLHVHQATGHGGGAAA